MSTPHSKIPIQRSQSFESQHIISLKLHQPTYPQELERPSADRQFGQRVHAWVALLPGGLGARGTEVTEILFIEPATGEARSARDLETSNLYLGVESAWNDRNYWVNMQDCSGGCGKLDWELGDVRLWEHLLAGEPKEMRAVEDDEDEEVNVRRDFHMAMPASWVGRVDVPYEGEWCPSF